MSGPLNASALSGVLKIKYTQKKVYLLAYEKNPLFGIMPKKTDFGGKNKQITLRYATTAGSSSVFANAQSNVTASAYTAFNVSRSNYYGYGSIAGDMMIAAKGRENAVIDAASKEVDGAIHKCMRKLAIFQYRNGGGALGQITSGSTTATVTLKNIPDITNFEFGDVLQASTDDGTGGAGVLNAGATVTVTAVDRSAGTLTVAGTWVGTIPGITDSSYLFAQGDYNNVAAGVAGWIPPNGYTGLATAFNGVVRNVDAVRLAGLNYAGNGGPIEETLIEVAARAGREGAKISHCMVNPLDFSNICKALAGRVVFNRVKSFDMPQIDFKAAEIVSPDGTFEVMPDLNCPKGTMQMMQMDTWAFESAGPAPQILDFDGLMLQRDPTSDSYSARVGAYGATTNEAPNYNANITI